MAGCKGTGAVLGDVPEALIREVAHICNDVQPLHLGQELEALFFQAGLRVGLAGPDGIRVGSRHHIGAGQLVFVVPGQGHHPDAQLMHEPQHAQAALAAAALFNGQHSADLARLRILADVLRLIHRRDKIAVLCHDPLEDVDLLQRRHQRVLPRAGQVDKGCKALQHVVPFLQLFQVDL